MHYYYYYYGTAIIIIINTRKQDSARRIYRDLVIGGVFHRIVQSTGRGHVNGRSEGFSPSVRRRDRGIDVAVQVTRLWVLPSITWTISVAAGLYRDFAILFRR